MLETRSSSSSVMSSIQFNSKSLNPLDSIHPSVITKIKRQADIYLGCSHKCATIWAALTKNQIAGSNMTENVIEVIFKEFQSDFSALTKISSLKQFLNVFDQDKDGCLNFDEQIHIFSYIKEKMELVASNCLQIQDYLKFQILMKQVRTMQSLITAWQQQLRKKVHAKQIHHYRNQSEGKINEFCIKFQKEFENMQTMMIKRREKFEKQIFYQTQALEEKLNKPTQYLKIKPKTRIKQLQFQEKLVSLDERIYEALDFRRELQELEKNQKDRVDEMMVTHAEQQRQNLRNKHLKKRKELDQKLQEMENKFIINMKKQLQVLKKKNNLHQPEIKRLQALQMKWAKKKGVFEPEMKRIKKLKIQRNEVLSEYKKSMKGTKTENNEDHIDKIQSGKIRKFDSNSILQNATNFKLIKRSSACTLPNIGSMKEEKDKNNFSNKINHYLAPHSVRSTFSLCKLYDTNLKEQSAKPVVSQQILEQQKTRRYNFMNTKLM